MTKYSKDEVTRAMTTLLGYLKPGDTVYTSLKSVSRSGMSRRIRCYVARGKDIEDITYYVSRVLGDAINDKGILMSGCGMDMGFALVYGLSRRLFPEGFVPAKAKMSGRNGEDASKIDTDGGYALRHRWL